MKTELEGYLNMGYEYVCTCLVDAKGLQESMGQSKESTEIFGSCSESGSNDKIAAEAARAAKEQAKIDANLRALALAARNKTIKDTTAAMKIIKDSKCDALGVAANVETCFAAVQRYSREYGLVFRMRDRAYDISGGDESTKNRTQRDARVNAVNIRDGILAGGIYFRGANTTLKPRFTDKGAFEPSCWTAAVGAVAATTVYGATAVKTCEDAYVKANTVAGYSPQKANLVTGTKIQCRLGNLSSGTAKTDLTDYSKSVIADACATKELGNGYVQYVDDLTVTCDGPKVGAAATVLKTGKNCYFNWQSGKWMDKVTLSRDRA